MDTTQEQAEAIEDVLATVRFRITTLPPDDPWRLFLVRLAVEIEGPPGGGDRPGLHLVLPANDL